MQAFRLPHCKQRSNLRNFLKALPPGCGDVWLFGSTLPANRRARSREKDKRHKPADLDVLVCSRVRMSKVRYDTLMRGLHRKAKAMRIRGVDLFFAGYAIEQGRILGAESVWTEDGSEKSLPYRARRSEDGMNWRRRGTASTYLAWPKFGTAAQETWPKPIQLSARRLVC